MKTNASLVVPLFNNEKTLVRQLKKCLEVMKHICNKYELIICDDKSTDSSRQLLEKYFLDNPSFKIIFNKKNQGIAKTIKNLYKKARYQNIVLFSVDGDWNPNDITRLLQYMIKNNNDIVIGKRKYIKYSFYRKFISFFYNYLPFLLFQVKTIDAGSIKVIKRELIHSIPLNSRSVFFEAELIIRAAKEKKKISSIPVSFRKRKESKGFGGKMSLVTKSLIDLIYLRLRI